MKRASTKRTSCPPFKSCEKAELKHAKQYYSVKQQNIQCAPARKGVAMNVRKPVDYSTMYRELAAILAQNLPQMDEIHVIGKAISQRPEKGAAVAAAEFLQANFPDRTGFSPRNVRRMRDFYRTYENDQTLLRLAMKIGWMLNVVIMEADLTRAQRMLCLQMTTVKNLSKKELLEIILNGAFVEEAVDEPDEICNNITNLSEDRNDQTQFEPPRCRAVEGKRGFARCGRRKISLLVSCCCCLSSGFLSKAYYFPYLQAWLGSS